MLENALDRYFAAFEPTRQLIGDLIRKRKYPIETLILLCARLDGLASDAAKDGSPSKDAFVNFVTGYGGKKDLLTAISIGDLYYELAYHCWVLEGTIPTPGRLHRFSRLDDPIIDFLDKAGLPLTLEDSEVLLGTIMRILKLEFRAVPRQSLAKRRFVQSSVLIKTISDRASKTRLAGIANKLPEALKSLLIRKTISTILYEKFRCESIHGSTMILDSRKFFTETEIYWKSLYSEYYGAFELIEFPAQFLLSLLDQCIRTYRSHLLAKRTIPPAVHFHVFGDDMFTALEFLDMNLLADGGAVRFRIG